MQKLKELYITIAEFLQGLSNSTMGIIMGVMFAMAFYNFALFIKANKGDKPKFNALSKLCAFLILLIIIVFVITCYNY